MTEAWQQWRPLIGAVVVFGVLGFGLHWWSGRDERAVKGACEQAVGGELKTPATAHFVHTLTWEPSPGSWLDNGTVDAQNTYGAVIRSQFRCEVAHEGGEWQVKDSSTV